MYIWLSQQHMKYRLFFALTYLIFISCSAQDTLLALYKKSPNDLKKIQRGLNLMETYREQGEIDKGIALGFDLIALAGKNKWDTLQADAFIRMANLYDDVGSFDTALNYGTQALTIHKNLKKERKQAYDHSTLGAIYYNQSIYTKALEHFLEARKIRERINDVHGLGQTYNNIANIYRDLDKPGQAYEYRKRSIAIYKKENYTRGIAALLLNTAFDLAIMKETALQQTGLSHQQRVDTVYAYYREALRLFEQVNMPEGIGATYGNLGLFYTNQEQYDSARIYQEKSYAIYKAIGSKGDMAASLGDLSIAYQYLKNYPKAIQFGLQAKVLAEETGNRYALKEIYRNLYTSYKAQSNLSQALLYHEKWKVVSDSLKGEEEQRDLTLKSLQYDFGIKSAADSTRNSEEKKVKDAEIKAQQVQLKQEQTQRYFLFAGVALLIVFGGFMYNRFKVTQKQRNIISLQKEEADKQKHIIEEKQKEILDSIYYARRIQRSLITNESYITKTIARLKGK